MISMGSDCVLPFCCVLCFWETCQYIYGKLKKRVNLELLGQFYLFLGSFHNFILIAALIVHKPRHRVRGWVGQETMTGH